LKTADIITDALGTIKADSDYYPWGGELQFVNNDSNHYKFTGKERDTETGVDYFGARYYSNRLGRWLTPDWSPKPLALPYAKLDDPQSLNLYSYVVDNPTGNVDPDGHACSFLLGNTGSGFCQRATEYGKIDAQVHNKTRFFAGASAVSQSLAGADAGFGEFAFSKQTGDLLEIIGHSLRTVNLKAVSDIKSGAMHGAGPELDAKLVHMEQTEVQKQLDTARQFISPGLFDYMMGEINKALNPSGLEKLAGTVFSTDAAMAKVFDDVRKELHHDIDFRNQGDREAMGNAIIKHIRDTGGKDVTGDKVQ
jgi:RHS repeat-associated protein